MEEYVKLFFHILTPPGGWQPPAGQGADDCPKIQFWPSDPQPILGQILPAQPVATVKKVLDNLIEQLLCQK